MVGPFLPDADKLVAVREALPALGAGIYLNAGSVGPLPAETAAAMAQQAERELTAGRAHQADLDDALERLAEARAGVAALLGTDTAAVALTHGTTDAMNAALTAIDWRPGDRVVTTTHEHPAALGPLAAIRGRYGVEVVAVDLPEDGDPQGTLAALDPVVTPRTRLVAVSHVSFMSGAVLPVARIGDLAHGRGALFVVDGAQAAGAIPVRFEDTGADMYALPAQKWLLGPEAMGALVVPPDVAQRLTPAFGGYFSFETLSPDAATWWPDARRFEWTFFHRPSVVGMARSLGWLAMFVGWEFVHRRGPEAARAMADRLAAIPGVTIITPRDHMATLVTFRIAGWDPERALEELGSRVFAIARTIKALDALRVSVGFYSSVDELERFAASVELLAAHTPDTLPARRPLAVLG